MVPTGQAHSYTGKKSSISLKEKKTKQNTTGIWQIDRLVFDRWYRVVWGWSYLQVAARIILVLFFSGRCGNNNHCPLYYWLSQLGKRLIWLQDRRVSLVIYGGFAECNGHFYRSLRFLRLRQTGQQWPWCEALGLVSWSKSFMLFHLLDGSNAAWDFSVNRGGDRLHVIKSAIVVGWRG